MRVARPGNYELQIRPWLLPAAGDCTAMMRSLAPRTEARLVQGRNYGGARWHPDALEQCPPPNEALQAYACRDLPPKSVLLQKVHST